MAPLLPVHQRPVAKRGKRKGLVMRLVIFLAVLFAIGYAAFAIRYVGTSKNRREARDSLVRAQLERKPGVKGGGRTLHVEEEVVAPDGKGHKEPRLDTDDGTYDAAITHGAPVDDDDDDHPAPLSREQALQRQREEEERRRRLAEEGERRQRDAAAEQRRKLEEEDRRRRHQLHSHVKAQAAKQPPGQQPADSPATTTQQQQQPGHTASPGGGQHPVVVGPVESDREAEDKREQAATAPSLAVGSRIESDRASEEAAVSAVEPGGVRKQDMHKEPSADAQQQQHPVAHEPITVSNVEPEHQSPPVVHEPLPTSVPHETDSNTQPVHVPAPDELPPTTPRPVEATHAPSPVPTTAPSPTPRAEEHAASPHADSAPLVNPHAKGLYALSAVDIDGKVQSLSKYAGKVTLVVNVASACGYTDENYRGLTKTYEKYRAHGLEILGFPCNQFGSQESGTEADIKSFCSTRYHVNFPMFSKVDVNGPHTHPVYQFLKRELPESQGGGGGTGTGKDLIWNFQKILVDPSGKPVRLFYQQWDQGAVEQEIYRLIHEARTAGSLVA